MLLSQPNQQESPPAIAAFLCTENQRPGTVFRTGALDETEAAYFSAAAPAMLRVRSIVSETFSSGAPGLMP